MIPETKDIKIWQISIVLFVSIVLLLVFVVLFGFMKIANYGLYVDLAILLVISVIALIVALTFSAVIFQSLGLADNMQPLGLPEGSMQAVIALSLILIFLITSVFFFINIYFTDHSAGTDIAKQIITTVSTLAVAVAGFYFGNKSATGGKGGAATTGNSGSVPPIGGNGSVPPTGEGKKNANEIILNQ